MKMAYEVAVLKAAGERDGQKVYTFLASTDSLDRHGEVVTTDGWELAAYQRNPVVLDMHNLRSIESIIGRAVNVRLTDGGLEADIQFNATPRGQLAAMLVEGGDLRAVSVGFKPIEMAIPRAAQDPVKHTKKELVEISLAPVPINRDTLRMRGLDDDLETKAGARNNRADRERMARAKELLGELAGLMDELMGSEEMMGESSADGGGKALDGVAGVDSAAIDRMLASLRGVASRVGG